MGKFMVDARQVRRIKALAVTGLERVTLLLAVDAAIRQGRSPDEGCFPSVADVCMLKRLSRRLWVSVGVSDPVAMGGLPGLVALVGAALEQESRA